MHMKKIVVALAAAGFASGAYATNGMNVEGYGPIATGMGGASFAYDNGTAAMMNNVATLGLASEGSRLDLAVGMLGPDVTSKMTGRADAKSGGDAYLMPALGFSSRSGALSYGVGIFAQGGMGTEYGSNSFLSGYQSFGNAQGVTGLESRSELGVGRIILPIAFNVSDSLTVGGSVDYVWAGMDLKMVMDGKRFGDMMPANYNPNATRSNGTVAGTMVDTLATNMAHPQQNPNGSITDINYGYFDFSDTSDFTQKTAGTGLAGKLGLVWKASQNLTVGASYHSKTSISDMDGDATVSMQVVLSAQTATNFGLSSTTQTIPVTGKIAIKDFQWPETYGLGLAYQATPSLLVAIDYKRINWADVMKSFTMTFTADTTQANPLAAGFQMGGKVMDASLFQNWEDQNVVELGAAYKATDALTLRVGANLASNPIPNKYLNPLFPATVENHYTLGAGYALSQSSEINFSVQMAPEVSNVIPNDPSTTADDITVTHSQTSWQLMYSMKF